MKKFKSNCRDMFELYKRVRNKFDHTSLLESLGEYEEDTTRYSIMGVIPSQILYGNYNDAQLIDVKTNIKRNVNWISILDDWITYNENEYISCPIQPGAIGYIGYENKFLFEDLDHTIKKDNDVPDIYIVKYSLLLFHDRYLDEKYWILDDFIDTSIIKEIELLENDEWYINENNLFKVHGDLESALTKQEYIDVINKTIEYIRNGDIFQANITLRFKGRYSGDTLQLYSYLRDITPNPFFGYFDFQYPLISTSPERFIKICGRRISSYPIKGTIKTIINNKDTRSILENSEKDKAENTMIVDLMRNDIGRICKQHSVRVPILCGIKKFNFIYHLESIILGELKSNVKFSDILKATFPGGSITGAPKIRSMDIIEELEPTTRGPYCGLTGFFGQNGWIDTSIAIRILYFDDSSFYYHAGGGIVVDSVAESEYQELIDKLHSINKALDKFNVLKECRKQIDEVDIMLLDIMNKRFQIIDKVKDVKKHYQIPILQKNRVDMLIKKQCEISKTMNYNLSSEFIYDLYNIIIKHSMYREDNEQEVPA